jgi:RNA polymerase sigma-70 factor (ECF subfamily)
VQSSEKDLALIDRILTGDALAYRELTNRHKDYAYTVAYRIVGNREDAQEIAQDAFLRAFKALDTFNREAKFTTWFYRIVFNAAVGFKRKHRLPTQDVEETHHAALGVTVTDSADAMKQRERQQYIEQALQHLSPDDVMMITLFYLKEFTLEEIAEITGIPANTAKVKLHRARKRLADELNRMLKGEAQSLI